MTVITEKVKKDIAAASNIEAIQGRCIKADHSGTTVHVGNKELFTEKERSIA